eukprot:gene5369-547_t
MADCRGQAYDVAAAMSSDRKEKSTEIEKRRQEEQRKALQCMHDKRKRNPEKSRLRCDGEQAYVIAEPPDSLLDALRVADRDIFPSIRRLLVIDCISPIVSCEAERAASGVRRLKTVYRSTMTSQRESDLNLIQMRFDLLPTSNAVVDAFIKQQPRRIGSSRFIKLRQHCVTLGDTRGQKGTLGRPRGTWGHLGILRETREHERTREDTRGHERTQEDTRGHEKTR